jgi:tetratricopeptide (TPR) repeat protein
MLGATALVLIGIAIRVHNAFSFPVLAGYDGFGHFTYVWFMAETWRVPIPTSGWGFFHPPFYYALMAGLWSALSGVDPITRLRVGIASVAMASLVHTFALWAVLRRRSPGDGLLHLLAGCFLLFLPVQIYAAEFLGNEMLNAVLCTVGFLVLLSQLRCPSYTRCFLLGVVLGLAMLTKFTSIAVVAGALMTLGLRSLHVRPRRLAATHLAITVATLLVTCGWYYARNVERYGTPFVLSRRELIVRLVEDSYPQIRRSPAEYFLFDPLIFRRPTYPRGSSDPADAAGWSQAIRNSVWTGVYANTWFDGFGGWAAPRATGNELARRTGQALLILGLMPTLVVIVGMSSALTHLRRRGWDDLLVVTLLTLTPTVVIFVLATYAVPIAAAVKATYLAPATLAFGVCFAIGLDRLRRWRRWSFRLVGCDLVLVSALSVAVFWHGFLFEDREIRGSWPLMEASTANQTGVVYYAAGDRTVAHEHFVCAADHGLYLGYENLALLAFQDGRPDEALHLLKRALRLQPAQSFGNAGDRALYDRRTRAEYLNLFAVFEYARGSTERARRAAAGALRLDPTLPEAHYDLALATFASVAAQQATGTPTRLRILAREHLDKALELDPAFAEARSLKAAVAATLAPGCVVDSAPAPHWERSAPGARLYPVETGPGAPYAASIGRRRHIGMPDWFQRPFCHSD